MRNVHVLEADIGTNLVALYRILLKTKGLSRRAQARAARVGREALRKALIDTIIGVYRDRAAPHRTGRTKIKLLSGVRAFGSNLSNIRGHILGPGYVLAHENGALITPKRASKLAIPVPGSKAVRADGSPKLPGPRSWQNILKTFVYTSKKTGNSYIAYRSAKGRLELLYVLVDSSQLSKYKGFLSDRWDREKLEVIAAIGVAIQLEMRRVNIASLARMASSKGRRR